jgi:hypothetical protein
MNTLHLRMLRTKASVALSLFGAVMAIASMGSASALPSSSTAIPSRCLSGWLSVSFGSGNGTAGSTYYPLNFKNISKSTCSLYGYPGVSALRYGRQMGSAAVWEASVPKDLVIVKPGATVYALLQVTDVSVYSKAQCEPETANQLKIYPPGATTAKIISQGLTGCSVPSIAYMHVEVVRE